MESSLKCNSLKCRTHLDERAVVTTCSHIFCVPCSERLGLATSNLVSRICPACETRLGQDDDVVVSQLNPTEDYKTSVLSGLSPSIIIDCASRGLAFYAYQTTQEILYQEFLCKNVTDRHNALSNQLDAVVHEANGEISILRDKLSAMDLEQKDLQKKNAELVEVARQKTTAYRKLEKLYRSVRQQQTTADMETAVEHEVDAALRASLTHHRGHPPPPLHDHGTAHVPQRCSASFVPPASRSWERPMPPPTLPLHQQAAQAFPQQTIATPSQRSRLPSAMHRGSPHHQYHSLSTSRSPFRSASGDGRFHSHTGGGISANVKMGKPSQGPLHTGGLRNGLN